MSITQAFLISGSPENIRHVAEYILQEKNVAGSHTNRTNPDNPDNTELALAFGTSEDLQEITFEGIKKLSGDKEIDPRKIRGFSEFDDGTENFGKINADLTITLTQKPV